MLREFEETENSEKDIYIDEYEGDLIIDDEGDLLIDGKTVRIISTNTVDNHSILCSYVEDLDPRVIDMILKTFPDINTYVAYVEELHQERLTLVGRIYEHLASKACWRDQEAVMLNYGLIDGIPKTLAEVAEIMGYPEEVIRNRIKWCLSLLFQKIHHERARREFFKEMCQEERPSNDCSDKS